MAANTEHTVTVKLVLDTTEFDAAVERVKFELANLVVRPRIGSVTIDPEAVRRATETMVRDGRHVN